MGLSRYRSKTLTIWLAAVVLAVLLLGYGAVLVRQINEAYRTWLDYSDRAIQADKALDRLTEHLGYGGFIHDFKNYVLRQDADSLPHLQAHLAELHAALDAYLELPLSDQERDALRAIRRTLDEYAGKLEVVQALVAKGQPPEAIDRQVKVDDTTALAALALLDQHAQQSERLGRQQTSALMAQVVERLKYGMWLVALLIPVAMLMAHDRRRIDVINRELEASSLYINDLVESVPDALLVVGEDGRILRANVAAKQLFGYSREQLRNMTVEELMPERYRGRHAVVRAEAVENSRYRPMGPRASFVILTREGHEVPVDIGLSYTCRDEQTEVLVSLRDISDRQQMEMRLRRQQEVFKTAQAIAHVGSWDWNIESNELAWSDEIYRIFGVEPQAFVATYEAFVAHVHPDDREKVQQGVLNAVQLDIPYVVEHRVVRQDGSERVVLEKGEVFRDPSGEPVRMVGTVLDITERKRVEQELLFDKAIIEGVSQPIVVVDQALTIIDVNDAYCEMTGYSRDQLLGNTPAMLKSGRHDQTFYKAMWYSINRHMNWQGEIWIRNQAGTVIPRLLSITRICQEETGTSRYVGFYSDITALKESEARLEKLAHFDQLTGLANRMLFHDRLRAAMARAHRANSFVALLYIDLDGFKEINDRLGHQTGDMLLVEAAERMKSCIREDDTVARLGGDEFAIILNEVSDQEESRGLAERLLQQLKITMGAGTDALYVSGSIGIATYPQDGEDVELLLDHADQAMYQAKQAGKNAYACYRADAEDADPLGDTA